MVVAVLVLMSVRAFAVEETTIGGEEGLFLPYAEIGGLPVTALTVENEDVGYYVTLEGMDEIIFLLEQGNNYREAYEELKADYNNVRKEAERQKELRNIFGVGGLLLGLIGGFLLGG
jgi:hypothetical protein